MYLSEIQQPVSKKVRTTKFVLRWSEEAEAYVRELLQPIQLESHQAFEVVHFENMLVIYVRSTNGTRVSHYTAAGHVKRIIRESKE